MRLAFTAVALLTLAATPASARKIKVFAIGGVDRVTTICGAATTLSLGDTLQLSFDFDSNDLSLVRSGTDFASYRFSTRAFSGFVAGRTFQPVDNFGYLTFSRGRFAGGGQDYYVIQSFRFSGSPSDAPFSLPGGVADTSLTWSSLFLYGDRQPGLSPASLTDPDLSKDRASFSFSAFPASGNARASASGFGGISFFSAVPEPATWALMLFGFGATGAALRRRRLRIRFGRTALAA